MPKSAGTHKMLILCKMWNEQRNPLALGTGTMQCDIAMLPHFASRPA